jgi:hypothetical protein
MSDRQLDTLTVQFLTLVCSSLPKLAHTDVRHYLAHPGELASHLALLDRSSRNKGKAIKAPTLTDTEFIRAYFGFGWTSVDNNAASITPYYWGLGQALQSLTYQDTCITGESWLYRLWAQRKNPHGVLAFRDFYEGRRPLPDEFNGKVIHFDGTIFHSSTRKRFVLSIDCRKPKVSFDYTWLGSSRNREDYTLIS